MKIAQINMLANGSTGKIMFGIADAARAKGHEVRTFSPFVYSKYGKVYVPDDDRHVTFGTRSENRRHYYVGTVFGVNGWLSKKGTKQLVRELEAFSPDVIHLHNLHNFTFHLPTLFGYIQKNGIKTVWTLHDCWSFTGHCPHFEMIGCEKWKSGCGGCPQKRIYPKTLLDTTRRMYRKKKALFGGVEDMTLVTPSKWLASLVGQSFLRDYPVQVVNNGIDLALFKPTASDVRARYDCEGKYLLLGVAFDWGKRKGLDVFCELARRLDDRYRIMLVGTNEHIEAQLPANVITVRRTADQAELAALYTAADVFVNPTREDTFPTVNIEALACGTPIVTFCTGGSPEIGDDTCAVVVDRDDTEAMLHEIERVCEQRPYAAQACRDRAMRYDATQQFEEYLTLYEA